MVIQKCKEILKISAHNVTVLFIPIIENLCMQICSMPFKRMTAFSTSIMLSPPEAIVSHDDGWKAEKRKSRRGIAECEFSGLLRKPLLY